MSDWDLMMPGMGLTAIGVAGVTISYSGIAHTFIDGMHALTGLTLFIGLIFLSAGILNGGVSTSNRAKATTLVILSIILSFGMYGFVGNSISTLGTFSGILLMIAAPAIVIAYLAVKMPVYLKPMGSIFAMASATGVIVFIVFGTVGPSPYLLDDIPEIEIETTELVTSSISILKGSIEQGNPDYSPEQVNVPIGYGIQWTNDDDTVHTVTSSLDVGETFDSGLIDAGDTFTLDTTNLAVGEYEYFCSVHPWMSAYFVVDKQTELVEKIVSMPQGAGIIQDGQIYYDPEDITIPPNTSVKWENDDTTIHTITATDGQFDSGLVSIDESFTFAFTQKGVYDYFCEVHPWMTGTVTVE